MKIFEVNHYLDKMSNSDYEFNLIKYYVSKDEFCYLKLVYKESDTCEGCVFEFDSDLDGHPCPTNFLSCDHRIYIKLDHIKDSDPTYISISAIKDALCNDDICAYYKSDLSCKGSNLCLIDHIIKTNENRQI